MSPVLDVLNRGEEVPVPSTPATTLAVPVRNLHSTVGIAHMKDITNTLKLLLALLKKPPTFVASAFSPRSHR